MRWQVLAILLFIIPFSSAVQISEIMYDLEGGDAGYEWVEIYNDGEDTDLCQLRFYEQETNHYVKGDDCHLASGEYAIIADQVENINVDCLVLDSTFSLSNSGELLCLRNSGDDLFCVEYSSAMGASGNGESLQFVNGEWQALEPTPCSDEVQQERPEKKETDPEQNKTEAPNVEEKQESYEAEVKEEPKQERPVQLTQKAKNEAPAKQKVVYVEPETVGHVTSNILYESKSEKQHNVPMLLLLTVSITLNVVFIASLIRKANHERV
jgi:hypothetical protein